MLTEQEQRFLISGVESALYESREVSIKIAKKGRKDHNFKVGSLVWLSNENLRFVRPCRKLDSKRVGPFKIVKFVHEVAILFGFIVFHVSLLLLY